MLNLVCYATPSHEGSQLLLKQTAEQYGIKTYLYSPKNLDDDFINKNKNILSNSQGAGFWIWKPYIILDTLKQLPPDDTLIYMDSDCIFINDPKPMNDFNHVALYASPRPVKVWTKRECFQIVGEDTPEYHSTYLTAGGVSAWKNTPFAIQVLNEWLHHAQDPRLSTRDPGKNNFPEFKRHSTDQSILTMLAIKYKINRVLRPDLPPKHYPEFDIIQTFPYQISRVFGRFDLQQLQVLKNTPYLTPKGQGIQSWFEIPKNNNQPLQRNPFYEGDI